jgi:hypothetical protein
MIINEISKEEVCLGMKFIILGSKQINEKEMQVICSQSVSHVLRLSLGKAFNHKMEISYAK